MKISLYQMTRQSTGGTDIIDLTTEVSRNVKDSGIEEGTTVLMVPGSTGALTTIEYESGVVEDLKEAIDRIAPKDRHYRHDARWGDGNGYSHVRAALLGPSLTIPISEGRLILGTWQQVVLCDFDNRPRQRRIIQQVLG